MSEGDPTSGEDGAKQPVRCRVGGRKYTGPAIELAGAVEGARLLEAIRCSESGGGPQVTCPSPGPLFEHVGHVHEGMGLRTRTALARAGRSLGLTTPYDDDLAEARDELAALETRVDERARKREAVATHEETVSELRERVAAARGRLAAKREVGEDTTEAVAELQAAIKALSEHETEVIAARQELTERRAATENYRDQYERRFALEDRIANLERQARKHLVEQCRERFVAALDALPGATVDGEPFAADPVPAALAIARVGDPRAPVVLDCDRFASAAAAHDWLGCPVVRL